MTESSPLHVMVTGAADGIGLAAAERYARAGHRVTLLDVAAERLGARVEALAAEGLAVRGEVADPTPTLRRPERSLHVRYPARW